MRTPYRWIGIALAVLLVPALAKSQLFVVKGFNDPVTLVDQMMSKMPHSLGLTGGERKQVRRIYIDLSRQEQKINFQPGSSFAKRAQVRRIDDEAERKILALLGRRRYEALQQWMHKMHHPKRVNPPHRSVGR
jgi:hypothetical protein